MDAKLEEELAAHREARKEILKERKIKEEKKAAKAAEPVLKKKLKVERTPSGLYYLVFDGGGELPTKLKSYFTTIAKLREAVKGVYGSEDWICQQ